MGTRTRIRVTDAKRDEILKMYADGWLISQIHDELGIAESTLRFVVTKSGIQKQIHGWTREEVDTLVRMRAEGKTYRVIAPHVHHSANACYKKYGLLAL